MAFYRCGGGGIPSSLKTDMNSVLNKKFGTSSDYPPADWAPTVNLMGPLPEKTIVSSPIADFQDGADDVPTKSVKVTIPASLSGVSSVTVMRTGRNLFDKTTATIGKYINVNGQEATNEIKAHSVLLPLKPSTSYYMSGYAYGSYYSILALDKDMNVLSTWYGGASKTEPFVATTPNNARWCYLNFNADQIDTVIFAESATAISFEAYDGTTSTVNLGRTIYGGTADIVNGTGKETCAKYAITGQETGYYLAGTNNNGNRIDFPLAQAQTPLYTGGLSNIGENKACLNSATWTIGAWCVYSSRLYFVVPNEYTTYETALQYLVDNNATFVFPLDTPTDFTFTGQEVPTRLGYNAFWSDSGDTEVTYRADINLALGGQ